MTTHRDYDLCIEQACITCEALGSDMVSMLLYGSIARATLRPGKSDVFDGVVVLANRAVAAEEDFYRALRVMEQACVNLAATGLPFHSFHYCSIYEFEHCYPAIHAIAWHSDQLSKVLRGRDIRPSARFHDRLGWARQSFFAIRRDAQALRRFVVYPDLLEENAMRVARTVGNLIRRLPLLACLVCDVVVDESGALQALHRLFPDFESPHLDMLSTLHKLPPEDFQLGVLKEAVYSVCLLSEQLHDRVVSWLQQHARWKPAQGWKTPCTSQSPLSMQET